MIPIPVVTTAKVDLKMAYPKSTPIKLKKISESTMTVLLYELNCRIRINKMSPTAMNNAFCKKAAVSASCSPSPVCAMVTPSGLDLKASICFLISSFTDCGV